MDKNININMIQFEQQLRMLISNSQLPVGAVYYILKQYWNEIQEQYYSYIQQYNTQQEENIVKEQSSLDENDS